MHKSRFRFVAIFFLLVLSATVWGSWYDVNQNWTSVQDLMSVPIWVQGVFVGILQLMLAFVIGVLFYLPNLVPDESGAKCVARKIAERQWYVKGASVASLDGTFEMLDSVGWHNIQPSFTGPAGSLLFLVSRDSERDDLILPFRPGHPDAKGVKNLLYLDVVEFEFSDGQPEHSLPNEASAYLRLKSSPS